MRKIRPDEVVFSVHAEQDDIPVRGNALASGDAKADKRYEDRIIRRLESGDVWAWAHVTVKATLTLPDGSTIEGSASLGGCCYRNEKDFTRPGGYYDDMKHEALADLQRAIENEITRGARLAEIFAQCPWATPARRCELAPGHEGDHVLPKADNA